MGLRKEKASITELWRIENELQFRQIHSVEGGTFLLCGGLDSPTWPQSQLSCALALLDVQARAFRWKMELKRHKCFDYSCATLNHGIGVIPHKFKSDFCGLVFADIETGLKSNPSFEIANVKGIVPLSDNSFAFATFDKTSQLWIGTENAASSIEISEDENFRIASLAPFSKTHVVTVMQHSYLVDGKGRISFVHQLRSIDGSVCWEYRSKNDTCVKASDSELLLYSNASDRPSTQLEFLSAIDGDLIDSLRIASSISSVTPISDRYFLFCNPSYNMCLFDRSKKAVDTICSFPSIVPGWLTFAVDTSHRIIIGCKADNFISPKSTIAAFAYA